MQPNESFRLTNSNNSPEKIRVAWYLVQNILLEYFYVSTRVFPPVKWYEKKREKICYRQMWNRPAYWTERKCQSFAYPAIICIKYFITLRLGVTKTLSKTLLSVTGITFNAGKLNYPKWIFLHPPERPNEMRVESNRKLR